MPNARPRDRCLRATLPSVGLAAALLAAAPGAAGKGLGQFKSWHAQTFDDKSGKTCSLWSQPEKSEGEYTRRGEVFIFVTHSPAKKSFDRVSFEIGYTFKESSAVHVTIGSHKFDLSSGGSAAWAKTAKEDKRLVRAMRGGRTMVVAPGAA